MSAAGSPAPVSDVVAGSPTGRVRSWKARRRALAVAAVVAVLIPLSGCAAGVQAETSRERPTIDGVGSAIGTLTIRNAYVGGPVEQGGSAPFLVAVFNSGTEPDRLVSISSPEATGFTVPADTSLPSGGQQLFYTADRTPRLTGLTMPAHLGDIVHVVLTFERAGELPMDVPVSPAPPELLQGGASASPAASGTPSANPSATPSAAGSASPSASASPSSAAPPPAPTP